MTEPRKATDIIISLESKIDQILEYVKAIELNTKLILNKSNQPPLTKETLVKTTRPKAEPEESILSKNESSENTSSGSKRVVQEKLLRNDDGKVVLLAQVEIFDSTGKLLEKTRTNSQGKWTASLNPGDYGIRVAKAATSTKSAIALNYKIQVPNGNGPFIMDVRKI